MEKAKTYTFELVDVEADVILRALQELPFKESSPIINKLFGQAKAQNEREQMELADSTQASDDTKQLLVEDVVDKDDE